MEKHTLKLKASNNSRLNKNVSIKTVFLKTDLINNKDEDLTTEVNGIKIGIKYRRE